MLLYMIVYIYFILPTRSINLCPSILYPPPMHVIPKNSDLYLLLQPPFPSPIIVEIFNLNQKHTPFKKSLLYNQTKSNHTAIIVSNINFEIGSYGIQLYGCSEFIIVLIAANNNPPDNMYLNPTLLANPTNNKITILTPMEGDSMSPGTIYIHISLHLSIATFCLQLSHMSDDPWCFAATVTQPLRLDNVPSYSHVLRVWNPKNQKEMDVVTFDVEPLNIEPYVDIVTPHVNQIMHTESVWFKFQFRPSSLFNRNLCIDIDDQHRETCGLDSKQPHQLHNMLGGTHKVCVWIEQQVSTVKCRTFTVVLASNKKNQKNKKDIEIMHSIDSQSLPLSLSQTQTCPQNVNTNDDNTSTFTIVVFACSRPIQLQQLWHSLLNATYGNYNIRLRFVVDRPSNSADLKNHEQVVDFLDGIKKEKLWTNGIVEIVLQSSSYGLKRNVLEFWTMNDRNKQAVERLIFLEDDVVVSPSFFIYLVHRDEKSKSNCNQVAGISLYRPQWNEISWTPFKPQNCTSYMLQLPCSWGAMYYSTVWESFLKWHKEKHNNKNNYILPKIPRSNSNFWSPQKSWKIYFLRYMMENDLYMWYPNDVSYSTTTTPVGTNIHNPTLSRLFDVELSKTLSSKSLMDQQVDISKLLYFDVHHICRKGNCSMNATKNPVNPFETDVSLLNNNKKATVMSCQGSNDTANCWFENVGFDSQSNTIVSYQKSQLQNGDIHPFVTSAFRHRCCMESISDLRIQTQPLFRQCDSNNTIQTTTFMIGIPFFPQYGHLLHHILNLYSSFRSVVETKLKNEKEQKRNVQIILMNTDMSVAKNILLHPLVVLLQKMVTRHKIWSIQEFSKQRQLSHFCFSKLHYGTSHDVNLYQHQSSLNIIRIREFSQRIHILFGAGSFRETTPHMHLVTRTAAKSRQISNLKDVVNVAYNVFGQKSVTVSDFSTNTTFFEQYNYFQKIDVLCAVHGTALLNALFLHAKAVIIHLMPYGTIGRMGTNTKNAALIWKERTLLILSSEDPKSSSYTTILEENGQLIGGQRLIKLQHQLALYPDKLWENNWMDGFNFFVNVDRVQINIKQFETILMKSKEFAEKSREKNKA